MSKKKLPEYELTIEDLERDGVMANALTSDPANGFAFVAFSKEEGEVKMKKDASKRCVSGILLAPDQRVYRNSAARGEHYVYFAADTIEKAMHSFAKRQRFAVVNLEHAVPVEDIYMVEFWATGQNDKTKDLGIEAPPRSWAVTFHVENEQVWNDIEAGVYKGFSIEGLFSMSALAMKQEDTYESFFSSLLDDSISDADKMDLMEKSPTHASKLLRDVFNPMSISETLKQFFTKHPEKEAVKAPENKTPEVTNLMEDETPSGETNPIDQRVSDLETAVKAILAKLDEILAKKPEQDEQAMSAIKKLEAQVEILSNTPQSTPEDEATKPAIKFSKEMKPAVANLLARITRSKN